jgi:hypothetical protein
VVVIGGFGLSLKMGPGHDFWGQGRLTLSQVLACLQGLFEGLLDPVEQGLGANLVVARRRNAEPARPSRGHMAGSGTARADRPGRAFMWLEAMPRVAEDNTSRPRRTRQDALQLTARHEL